MKRFWAWIILAAVLSSFPLWEGCRKAGDGETEVTEADPSGDTEKQVLLTSGIREIDVIGDVVFEAEASTLEENGVKIGDSLDIVFSGGYTAEDIPYYDDFFGSRGDTMLADLGGTLKLGGQYYDFAALYGIRPDETLTVYLHESGKYLAKYELYQLPTGYRRDAYETEEQFTNFRGVVYGSIAPGKLFRSASPVSDKYGRCEELGKKIDAEKIRTVLNLADTAEKAAGYRTVAENVQKMIENGDVIFAGTGINFYGDDFREHLAESLAKMSEKDAPYLIHCSLGRDRTGFVCALLEALMGASYEEITADYMQSFANVNLLDREKEPEKYELYRHELDEIFLFLTGCESAEKIASCNLRETAEQYLLAGGMKPEELERLKSALGK